LLRCKCVGRDRCGRFFLSTLGAAFPLLVASALFAQQPAPADGTAIQQILKTNCQPCHNDTTKTSGLALTTRETILAGGNRGAAVKPGSPDESLLVRAIEQAGDLKMPLGKKLQPDEISSIRLWIELGAPWPKDEAAASRPKGSDWWAFQPVKRVNPPPVEQAAGLRNPTGCLLRRTTESDGADIGSTLRAMLIPTVTLSTPRARCGNIATGSSTR